MNIVAMVAISNFPLWKLCLGSLLKFCNKIVVRFDFRNGDPEIARELESFCGDKLHKVVMYDGWTFPEWREECLRIAAELKPDIIVCPDQDEIFGDGIEKEIESFWFSEKKGMMFSYDPLIGDDGRIVRNGIVYPDKPHMKAFKWENGVSYYPYHGDAVIAKYCNPKTHWIANTKIKHYCCYRKEWEADKKFRSEKKPVTLLGFGPSIKSDIELVGQVWSLNNAYEAIPHCMKMCTRIFEMHSNEKREKTKAADEKLHFWHLDQEGKNGRRIIMQKQNELITNSETFPVDEMITKLGIDFFMGTPCYMLAMAIAEGFTEIRIYGLDQLDWEHTVQRECFIFWMGYALGRGIRVSGCLTWLERYKQDGKMPRYGYDWGPEFPEWMEKILWMGHPLQIHYKIPSRVVKGEMYDGKK